MTRRFDDGFWSVPAPASGDAIRPHSLPREVEEALAASRWPRQDAPAEEEREPALPHFTDWPARLFVPEHYEAKYPYPLIIWLHGAGSNESELDVLMDGISTRNYFGMSFRGDLPAGSPLSGAFQWSQSETDVIRFATALHSAVCELRRHYHIHSERIYLAGFDDGAATALQLVLRRPEWFAGAIAFNGKFPDSPNLFARYRELRGRRVLIGAGMRDERVSTSDMIRTSRLLHAAGMHVSTRFFEAGHEITSGMLSRINHWIMGGISEAV